MGWNFTQVATANTGSSWTCSDGVWASGFGLWLEVGFRSPGNVNSLQTSPDTTTWTLRALPSTATRRAIAYASTLGANGRAVTVGNGVADWSDDGTTWTAATSLPETNNWCDVVWWAAQEIFVAVASSGVHRVMISTDGKSWTSQSAAAAKSWEGLNVSDTVAVAVAFSSSTNTQLIQTSPDGVTWTLVTHTAIATNRGIVGGGAARLSVGYSADLDMFLVAGTDAGNITSAWRSTDAGATWTASQTIPTISNTTNRGFFWLAGPARWYMSCADLHYGESTDGETFTVTDLTVSHSGYTPMAWSEDAGTILGGSTLGFDTALVGVYASIDRVSPAIGTARGGTVVTITGSGLENVAQGDVLFDGVAALAVTPADDGLSLTCITAAHAVGPVDVTVTDIGTLTAAYTYVGVTRVTPKSGTVEGGTPVTIRGYGFNATGEVLFTTTPDVANSWEVASNLVVVSNTELTCLTPPHASGVVSVLVQGVDVGIDLYTYTLGQERLPPIPYLVPPVEQVDQTLRGEWVRWLTTVKQRVETPVTVVPEQIVGGAPLAAVSDTNVRATLTGTPASALLQPVTITLDWQGILGVTRGGTGVGAVSAGALLYGAAAQQWAALSIGAADTFLKSDGSLPAWTAGAALTRTNDTNVTLTLGGSASSALVNAASLTLGWMGQLAVGRGGTGLSTIASGGLLYASALDTLSVRSIGSAGDVLTVSGGFPTWTATSAITVPYTSISSVPTATVLGRNTAGTGAAEALTTLPSAVQANIDQLGTVGTGVWNGTAIGATYGGTGLDSHASTGIARVSGGVWAVDQTFATGATAGVGYLFSADGLTSGQTVKITGSTVGSDGIAGPDTGAVLSVTGKLKPTSSGNPPATTLFYSGADIVSTAAFAGSVNGLFDTAVHIATNAGEVFGLYSRIVDNTALGNTLHGVDIDITSSANAAKTIYALSGTSTAQSNTANTVYGLGYGVINSGSPTTGTQTTTGALITASSTGMNGGTANVTGIDVTADGTVTSGTITAIGVRIRNGSMDTTGTSKQIGLQIDALSGADTNYALITLGGNVGISNATPTRTLDVTGTLAASGLITASGGILVNGGSSAQGRIVKDATSGTVIWSNTGATYDFRIFNGAGSPVMNVPTGTANLALLGQVGMGINPDQSVGFYVRPTGQTGVNQYGILASPLLSASATTGAYAIFARVDTAAAAFTVTSGYGVHIANPVLGAGSAMTTNYGLYVAAQTAGGTNYAIFTNTGLVRLGDAVTFLSSALSSHATAGIGYATGAGGTVTQTTNKSTGVTLNKVTGLITMNNAALAAATSVSFTLTDSAIAATDTILLQHDSAGTAGAYALNAQPAPAGGSATITVSNRTAGSLSEAIVIRFTVLKSVSA